MRWGPHIPEAVTGDLPLNKLGAQLQFALYYTVGRLSQPRGSLIRLIHHSRVTSSQISRCCYSAQCHGNEPNLVFLREDFSRNSCCTSNLNANGVFLSVSDWTTPKCCVMDITYVTGYLLFNYLFQLLRFLVVVSIKTCRCICQTDLVDVGRDVSTSNVCAHMCRVSIFRVPDCFILLFLQAGKKGPWYANDRQAARCD